MRPTRNLPCFLSFRKSMGKQPVARSNLAERMGMKPVLILSLQGPGLQNYDGIVWGLGETNCAHAVDDWIGVESIQDTPKILAGIGVGALGLFEGPRRR